MGQPVHRYVARTFADTVAVEGGKQGHIVLVVIQDGLVFDELLDEALARLEFQGIAHRRQLVAFVAVDKLHLHIRTTALDIAHQAVVVVHRWLETLVEIEIVVGNETLDGAVYAVNEDVDVVCRDFLEHQRQRYGVQKHVALFVDVPVECGDLEIVFPAGLDIERLAVVLYLHGDHHRIAGEATQLDSLVFAYAHRVQQDLSLRDLVAGFV